MEKFDEKTGRPARLQVAAVCFDPHGAVRKAFAASVMDGAAVSVPQGFVVRDGKIGWRQVFSQSLPVGGTDFEEQMKKVMGGMGLISHGVRPRVEAGPVEEAEAEEMSLF